MLKPLFAAPVVLFAAWVVQQTPAPPSNSSPPAQAQQAIPPEAVQKVNPVKPTPESQAKAKKMYGYDCAMCHGEDGRGKGDLVEQMKLSLKDYTDPAALKGMTDGELFFIIKNGRGQMQGEGDRLKTDDLWNMVIYVRSFAKR